MHSFSHSNRAAVGLSILVLLACVFAVAGQDGPAPPPTAADSQNSEKEPRPKSQVKGRVVYEDGDKPVRRAPIMLITLQSRENLDSATDRHGSFVIKHVPAGRYFVMINAPGIITPFSFMKIGDNGNPENWTGRIRDYCTEVEVDGANDVEVTVHARRGGIISGKVTYDDGEPAPDAQIVMMRREGKEIVPVITGISPATLTSLHTDDRGMYRISGLPPGEYIVSASETHTAPDNKRSQYGGGLEEFFRSDALSATFYGGSGKAKDATVLNVEAGSEVSDIDITFPDLATHAIGGTVTAKLDGHVLPETKIAIRNREQPSWFLQGSQETSTDAQGRWSFPPQPDGTYVVKITPQHSEPYVGSPEPENSETADGERKRRVFVERQIEITVDGADLGNLAIELAEGANVSGTVEVPKEILGEQTPGEQPPFVVVRWAYAGANSLNSANEAWAMNGTFNIYGLAPGKLYLSAVVTRLGVPIKGAYVKSILLNGHDLQTTPLTIAEGQSIKGVRVVVSSDLGNGQVQLVDLHGKPVAKRFVCIVPADSSRWLFPDAAVSGKTNGNGIFSFSGAPADYLVIVGSLNEPEGYGLEWIRAQAQSASHVKLQAGANKDLVVTVAP
jgi:hypothetical protein